MASYYAHLLPGYLLVQVLQALLFLQARCHAHGGPSSHVVQLVPPGLATVSSLKHGSHCTSAGCGPGECPSSLPAQRPCPATTGSPGSSASIGLSRATPGLPLPPELYPWLPLELIFGDMPATTSDHCNFCILAQEVFTRQ